MNNKKFAQYDRVRLVDDRHPASACKPVRVHTTALVSGYLCIFCIHAPHVQQRYNARVHVANKARSYKPRGRHNNYKTTGNSRTNTPRIAGKPRNCCPGGLQFTLDLYPRSASPFAFSFSRPCSIYPSLPRSLYFSPSPAPCYLIPLTIPALTPLCPPPTLPSNPPFTRFVRGGHRFISIQCNSSKNRWLLHTFATSAKQIREKLNFWGNFDVQLSSFATRLFLLTVNSMPFFRLNLLHALVCSLFRDLFEGCASNSKILCTRIYRLKLFQVMQRF